MNPRFRDFVEPLERKFQELISMSPVTYHTLPSQLPKRGIYIFSDGDDNLYVERSNRLRERLRGHCIPSATHYTATFAFRIAREKTGILKATYKKEGSRPQLVADKAFNLAFMEAIKKVANMNIRYIEVNDPISQALLEIYIATVLRTPYNDFDNH